MSRSDVGEGAFIARGKVELTRTSVLPWCINTGKSSGHRPSTGRRRVQRTICTIRPSLGPDRASAHRLQLAARGESHTAPRPALAHGTLPPRAAKEPALRSRGPSTRRSWCRPPRRGCSARGLRERPDRSRSPRSRQRRAASRVAGVHEHRHSVRPRPIVPLDPGRRSGSESETCCRGPIAVRRRRLGWDDRKPPQRTRPL